MSLPFNSVRHALDWLRNHGTVTDVDHERCILILRRTFVTDPMIQGLNEDASVVLEKAGWAVKRPRSMHTYGSLVFGNLAPPPPAPTPDTNEILNRLGIVRLVEPQVPTPDPSAQAMRGYGGFVQIDEEIPSPSWDTISVKPMTEPYPPTFNA